MIKAAWMEPVAWWVCAAVPITALCLGMYAVGQQVLRQSINDVPVQLAEDGAARLDAGEVPAALVDRSLPLVDIAASLSPWIVVYDRNGTPLENSGQLNGAPPQLPQGVFQNIDFWRHGHSWQPEPDVRQDVALVPTADGKYIVAAGHNMREMELHIEHLGGLMIEGWLATLGVTLVALVIVWGVVTPKR